MKFNFTIPGSTTTEEATLHIQNVTITRDGFRVPAITTPEQKVIQFPDRTSLEFILDWIAEDVASHPIDHREYTLTEW